MRHGPVRRAAGVALSFTLAAVAWAGQEPSGRQPYLRYCGACHGPQAKGDGVASSFMRPSPPDLTLLAKRHGGEFPMEAVVKTIDGREMPRVHGDPWMPIWGTILGEVPGRPGTPKPGGEQHAGETIRAIAEYLRTIQAR